MTHRWSEEWIEIWGKICDVLCRMLSSDYKRENRHIVDTYPRDKLDRREVCTKLCWTFQLDFRSTGNFNLGMAPINPKMIEGIISRIALFLGLELLYIGFSSESVLSDKRWIIQYESYCISHTVVTVNQVNRVN